MSIVCPWRDLASVLSRWFVTEVVCPSIGGALCESRDAGQNLVGSLGPDERLRILLMRIDEGLNRCFELQHAAKDAAAKLFGRQQREPSFDETEPRGVRRGEVHVEARAFGKPVPDQRRFMGPVIVHRS